MPQAENQSPQTVNEDIDEIKEIPEIEERPLDLIPVLDVLMDYLEKKAGEDRLRQAIEEAKADMASSRGDFEYQLNSLDNDMKQSTRDVARLVKDTYNKWDEALKSIEKALKSGDETALADAGKLLRNANEALYRQLEEFSNTILLFMGPTDIPILNHILYLYGEAKGGGPVDELAELVTEARLSTELAIRELMLFQMNVKLIEQEMLINIYRELTEGLEKIARYTESRETSLLEEGVKTCLLTYPRIKVLMPIMNRKRLTVGPTPSDSVNLLINVAHAFRDGGAGEEEYFQTVRYVEEDYKKKKLKFEALGRQEIDSVLVREEIERASIGLNIFGTALSFYYKYPEDKDPAHLKSAEDNLIEAFRIFQSSERLFEDIADREGKIPCFRCGHYNLRGKKTCEKCGAMLMSLAHLGDASTFSVTAGDSTITSTTNDIPLPENLEVLFIHVNKVADNEISPEEFAQAVENFHNLMESNKDAGMVQAKPADMTRCTAEERARMEVGMKKLEHARDLFAQGYADMEEGVNYLRMYPSNLDRNYLTSGVELIWEGNKKFHEIRKMFEGQS